MKITKITASSETTINLGNCQNWKPSITLEAELAPDDDPDTAIRDLQLQAKQRLAKHIYHTLACPRTDVQKRADQLSDKTRKLLLENLSGMQVVNIIDASRLPAIPKNEDDPF